MGRAKRNPSIPPTKVMGFASLYPSYTLFLFLHRHPDLEPAIAGHRIELLVIALEVRRIGHLHVRLRQKVIPDRVDGAADGRDMLGVSEHEIFLLGDPDE